MRNARSALSILATVGLLALMGCSSGSGGDEAAPTAPQATVTATTGASDETTVPEPETTVTAATTETTLAPGVEPTTSEITVTVDGEDVVFAPSRVHCHGEEGNIRRLVGKTGHGPPMVEVTWQDFVMVKLERHGHHYKAQRPSGVTLGNKSATFDRVYLDGAEVNGTLVCTDWKH